MRAVHPYEFTQRQAQQVPARPVLAAAAPVRVVDVDAVRALLAEVVAEAGRVYVTPKRGMRAGVCSSDHRYVWQGAPDCITAHVLTRLGVPVDALPIVEGVPIGIVLGEQWELMLDDPEHPLSFTDGAIDLLRAAQSQQDAGWSWGQILDAATPQGSLALAGAR